MKRQHRKVASRPFNPTPYLEFLLMSPQCYTKAYWLSLNPLNKTMKNHICPSIHTHPTSPHYSHLSAPATRTQDILFDLPELTHDLVSGCLSQTDSLSQGTASDHRPTSQERKPLRFLPAFPRANQCIEMTARRTDLCFPPSHCLPKSLCMCAGGRWWDLAGP